MNIKNKIANRKKYPVKVLQYGEGKFLRAFADYFMDIANEAGVFCGSVAVVQPIEGGSLKPFREQDCLYTACLRGKEDGKILNVFRPITCIDRAISCYADYDEYIALAKLDSLEFILSNTTEAGIVLHLENVLEGIPASYPGKLTQFLYRRYQAFQGDKQKGLIILPVELIDDNGTHLKECVLRLSEHNHLPDEFTDWINTACIFCNTLVDRIVTGYPGNDAEMLFKEIGYTDALLDVAEPFGLWVIESAPDISDRFPLNKAGLPVLFTSDCRPYKARKVRILNGAHTSMVLLGWLKGLSSVGECMADPIMRAFTEQVLNREIIPFVPLPEAEVKAFASAVLERFENPFIYHRVLDISLNSVSKWRERVLPSFRDYYKAHQACPPLLTLSFAGLLAFYTGNGAEQNAMPATRADGTSYFIKDDKNVLAFFEQASKLPAKKYVQAVAQNTNFWNEDLTNYTDFCELAEKALLDIQAFGAERAIQKRLEGLVS